MLQTETKNRIDSLRDILVGKIPTPTGQVEQITLAMIYKFMGDMDINNAKLGGKLFFDNQYQKYSWSNLMDSKKTAREMADLYSKGLEEMALNENLPELFRDIFRGAYLPFKDPQIIRMFLKEIDKLEYSHSEDLGDAFEYLLKTMGSQGGAGQFRTPRHIIDFIVDVVAPTSKDKIHDPACGTAGFLISAYKYILNHEKKFDQQELTKNFVGFDISQDMVRLSRVNMYLHNFPDPQISEYDTLGDDARWDEKFDVILANPPFMTPKGGIKPHDKFSTDANRAEVLFVAYIMDHLYAFGRAGVIVPEGIIFQSANAYKDLRKRMVEENFLYAVVSLPGGVFNPYAGVKTSILLFDRELAKKNDEILFIKINADGYDLGAQRRENGKNDLPEAEKVLLAWKEGKKVESNLANWVSKVKVKESGDYNLTGERYKEGVSYKNAKWPMVELGKITSLITKGTTPTTLKQKFTQEGINFIKVESITEDGDFIKEKFAHIDDQTNNILLRSQLDEGDVLFSIAGALGRIGIVNSSVLPANTNQALAILRLRKDLIIPRYAFYILKSPRILNFILSNKAGVAQYNLSLSQIRSLKIPLPPLSVQEEIVEELDRYQKIIDGAKQVLENWKPTIEINPEWEMVKLGEVLSFVGSGVTPLGGKETYLKEGVLFIRSQNVLWGECDFSDAAYISEQTNREMSRSAVLMDDVLFNITGASIGRCALYTENRKANVNQHVTILRCKENLLPAFLMYSILDKSIQNYIWAVQGGASRQALNYQQIRQFKIFIPPMIIQKQIVKSLESEKILVESNKKLIDLMQKRIEEKIRKVWGE